MCGGGRLVRFSCTQDRFNNFTAYSMYVILVTDPMLCSDENGKYHAQRRIRTHASCHCTTMKDRDFADIRDLKKLFYSPINYTKYQYILQEFGSLNPTLI